MNRKKKKINNLREKTNEALEISRITQRKRIEKAEYKGKWHPNVKVGSETEKVITEIKRRKSFTSKILLRILFCLPNLKVENFSKPLNFKKKIVPSLRSKAFCNLFEQLFEQLKTSFIILFSPPPPHLRFHGKKLKLIAYLLPFPSLFSFSLPILRLFSFSFFVSYSFFFFFVASLQYFFKRKKISNQERCKNKKREKKTFPEKQRKIIEICLPFCIDWFHLPKILSRRLQNSKLTATMAFLTRLLFTFLKLFLFSLLSLSSTLFHPPFFRYPFPSAAPFAIP